MSKLQKNWLEWSVFGVSLALVLCTVGYLTYEGVTTGSEPPNIEVRLGTPEVRPNNFIVPVTVINNGDQTAAGVHIEVVMEIEGSETARAELDLPFLPRHATRKGSVTFDKDPSNARLKARVLGYEKP